MSTISASHHMFSNKRGEKHCDYQRARQAKHATRCGQGVRKKERRESPTREIVQDPSRGKPMENHSTKRTLPTLPVRLSNRRREATLASRAFTCVDGSMCHRIYDNCQLTSWHRPPVKGDNDKWRQFANSQLQLGRAPTRLGN